MTGGTHVPAADCAEMRRLRRETSYTQRTLAHEFGISEMAVWYHCSGACSHDHDQPPVEMGESPHDL